MTKDRELNRQLRFVPGTTVKFKNDYCPSSEENKEYVITGGPMFMCGALSFWAEGLDGAYECSYFNIIKPTDALTRQTLVEAKLKEIQNIVAEPFDAQNVKDAFVGAYIVKKGFVYEEKNYSLATIGSDYMLMKCCQKILSAPELRVPFLLALRYNNEYKKKDNENT